MGFSKRGVSIFFFLFTIALLPVFCTEENTLTPIEQLTKNIVEITHEFVMLHSDDMRVVQHALLTDQRFRDEENQLYIFIHTYNEEKKEAICRGQGIRPELFGKNMWSLRTPNGRMLFHEMFMLVETEGEGWIEYDWLNPFTNTLKTKVSYIKGIYLKDGGRAWIGCGFWKD